MTKAQISRVIHSWLTICRDKGLNAFVCDNCREYGELNELLFNCKGEAVCPHCTGSIELVKLVRANQKE